MEPNYRRVLMDCVSTITDYDGGMEQLAIPDIHDEINKVYHEANQFKEIVKIMNDNSKHLQTQYAEIYTIITRYQDNLFI